MLRLSIKDLPEIIDVRIDLKKDKNELDNVCLEVGRGLGNKPTEIKKAQNKAAKIQKLYQKLLGQEMLPEDAMEMAIGSKKPKKSKTQPEITIAVVGYPYTIYDNYINVGLIKLLQKENVKIVTQDMLTNKIMNRQAKTLPKSMFWYFSNRALYGALHYIESQSIDGIIHVTAFACGPDAMVDRIIEIETHKRSNLPYLSLTIDEQTGEAGVRTRIEAFLDMLRYRRDKNED
jgi:predicted nucleotide-binding protein (sugar kinase/HSP70/actin superfamily)